MHDMRIVDEVPAKEEYFSLNINGVTKVLNVMYALGMVHDSEMPDIDWSSVQTDDIEHGTPEYWERYDAVTSQHLTDDPTIPIHKFYTNDHWLVTPEEIAAALNMWEESQQRFVYLPQEAQDTLDSPLWRDWIQFLRLAKENGGFRVH